MTDKGIRCMKCKNCHRVVENVGEYARNVVCADCTSEGFEESETEPKPKKEKKVFDKPMKEMVKDLLKQNKKVEDIAKELNISIGYVKTLKYTK